ncbi:MAG TPA: VTT domain-containing protein [Candidatus Paceibacterota bacterium]|nr:VTT domain-containing protein [Candidatus Paceibacterota bacterium]
MKTDRFASLWKAAQVPLFGLAIASLLWVMWILLDLPSKEVLLGWAKHYISIYGYPFVLIGSFLEALLLIGWYFPGSVIIFLSVILAPSPVSAAISVALVTCGLYAGYIFNFFLGKYGWYKLLLFWGVREQLEDAQKNLTKYGIRAIFLSYWGPGLAAFISTAAGILQYDFRRFALYSLIAVSTWDIFWGIAVYSIGEGAMDIFFTWKFLLLAIVIWIGARYLEERFYKGDAKNIA